MKNGKNSNYISEINKIVTQLPENKLEEVFLYLKKIEKSTSENLSDKEIIDKIFTEDKNLLKRLAQ